MRPSSLCVALLLVLVAGTTSRAQEYHYYYGNIHSHTSYSDGSKDAENTGVKTPAQAYAFAKQSKHFDFLGISEHNHSEAKMHQPDYAKGIQQCKAANKDHEFVCLYGMEFGTYANGHVLIYGVDKLINWEEGNSDIVVSKNDYNELWEEVSHHDGSFVTLAHPTETTHFSNLVNSNYSPVADHVICGTAVRNGPHESASTNYDNPPAVDYYSYYKKMLAAGYHVGPTVDHDNHNTTFGRTSQGRTVVLAKHLTQREIADAYRHMRFYASDDWNTRVNFTVNGSPLGSTVVTSEAIIDVEIADEDEGDTVKTVQVMMGTPGSRILPKQFIKERTASFRYSTEMLPDEHIYLYLAITQADRHKIYTAPIWVKGVHAE